MKKVLLVALAVTVFAGLVIAQNAGFTVAANDSIGAVLTKQTGKSVTLKLASGEELSGTVRVAGSNVVHLEKLSGKEFYDAAVDVDEIAAVIVRAR
jgi:ABC-type uncharacterized transport system ATPase subunit